MKILILTMSLIISTASLAGSGGGHSHDQGHGHSHGEGQSHGAAPISQEKSGEIARAHIERLVKSKKLDVSWKTALFDKSEKENFKGSTEWVVTFNNPKGIKGKKLYVFLKESGEFVAANFTGK